MNYTIAPRRSIKPSDGRWLLLAVVVHAVVFLIPLRQLPPVSISQSAELMVRLVTGEPDDSSELTEEKELPPAEMVREVLQPRPAIAPIVELGEPREELRIDEPETHDDVSIARILSMRESLTRRVPLDPDQSSPDQLGQPRAYAPPENWQPHAGAEALAPIGNTFNGMAAPDRVKVVDQWMAPDGSRNVIVETPAGLRLCGRAAAPDPMRPFLENVMHFHICGGDGAIPFKFKPRKPLNRDFIDPVAKDTNQP